MAASHGSFVGAGLPRLRIGNGLHTQYGLILPSSRVAAYVNSNGFRDGDRHDQGNPPTLSTLNEALAYARAGRGDYVIVEQDHAENISSADQMSNLVAGTRVIGLGSGLLRPTFTWTVAAATWLLDQADCTIENCRLVMASAANGGVTVAAPITVSAAGCGIYGCDIRFGDDANDNVTIGITTTDDGDDFSFEGNECVAATAAECTTFMQIVGSARAKLRDNRIVGATSSASVGLIRFLTTASTDVEIDGLYVRQNKAGGGAGDQAITGMAGISGYVNNLFMVVLGNNAANLTGAFGTPANMVFGRQCYVANTVAERAALFGTESA